MSICWGIEGTSGLGKGWAATIGNFDGVHLGHQALIAAARETADRLGAKGVVVVTFEPHPMSVLRPDKAPGVLTTIALKSRLLQAAGADHVAAVTPDYRMLNLSPKAFIEEYLIGPLGPRAVIEGPNFNFGYGRSGNVETLYDLGRQFGFEVVIVAAEQAPVNDGRMAMCSSSRIRDLLECGRVSLAMAALSRPYRLVGPVVPGRGIGRRLGFPTANIRPGRQVVPAEGVYAGRVLVGADESAVCEDRPLMPAVFSIGRAKTFLSDYPLLIEAHVLDADPGDLRGRWLAMDFVDRIRGQQRFSGPQALAEQIKRDCDTARGVLRTA